MRARAEALGGRRRRAAGFDRDEAPTLGRAVAGLNAYSKGKTLGLFEPAPDAVRQKRKEIREKEGLSVDLLHRAVPTVQTDEGLRALSKDKPIKPESVQCYLEKKFGDALDDAYDAMTAPEKSVDSSGSSPG